MAHGEPRGLAAEHPLWDPLQVVIILLILVEFSLVVAMFWVFLAAASDWAATYEEKDLLRLLGDEYREYQRRVPKLIPRRLRPAPE